MESECANAASCLKMCATSLSPHMIHHPRAPLLYIQKQGVPHAFPIYSHSYVKPAV